MLDQKEKVESLLPSHVYPPGESSEKSEVIKKGFAPPGNHDKRECRTVRAYATVVRWSTRN
jgi:hypothetical protein